MRRVILSVAALAVIAVSFATSVQAASPVQIRRVYFNPPGTDTGSNSSLNGEYVLLKNVTGTARTITGWTISDAQRHVYKFRTFRLGAYRYVYVHTGHGSDTTLHRYWNSSAYIWNNTGDRATLRNARGTLVDYCVTPRSGAYVNC